jgi:DNA-binding CsgD family transcriptional regulator
MSTATLKRDKEAASASIECATRLQQTICALLAEMPARVEDPTLPMTEDGEQILFDVDFKGARYLLIKMPQTDRKCVTLSPREIEIVRLVARGHQNKVIAVLLNISAWTVCTHLRRIFAKLGVTSRAAMVARLAEFRGFPEEKLIFEWAHRGSGLRSTMDLGRASSDEPSKGREAGRSAPAERLSLSVGADRRHFEARVKVSQEHEY